MVATPPIPCVLTKWEYLKCRYSHLASLKGAYPTEYRQKKFLKKIKKIKTSSAIPASRWQEARKKPVKQAIR